MSLLNSFLPQVQADINVTTFASVVSPIVVHVVYPLLELLFGVAILVFVWGVLQFVLHGDDPDARSKGQRTALWGTVGMVIMVSAWGIVYLVSNTVKGL